jgi:hypothetical protein
MASRTPVGHPAGRAHRAGRSRPHERSAPRHRHSAPRGSGRPRVRGRRACWLCPARGAAPLQPPRPGARLADIGTRREPGTVAEAMVRQHEREGLRDRDRSGHGRGSGMARIRPSRSSASARSRNCRWSESRPGTTMASSTILWSRAAARAPSSKSAAARPSSMSSPNVGSSWPGSSMADAGPDSSISPTSRDRTIAIGRQAPVVDVPGPAVVSMDVASCRMSPRPPGARGKIGPQAVVATSRIVHAMGAGLRIGSLAALVPVGRIAGW